MRQRHPYPRDMRPRKEKGNQQLTLGQRAITKEILLSGSALCTRPRVRVPLTKEMIGKETKEKDNLALAPCP
jgi:hypothetical protein